MDISNGVENEFNNTTNDDLARMIARGFEDTSKKADVDLEFKEVKSRLDKIEALLMGDYKRRIERLETEMKELREALALK